MNYQCVRSQNTNYHSNPIPAKYDNIENDDLYFYKPSDLDKSQFQYQHRLLPGTSYTPNYSNSTGLHGTFPSTPQYQVQNYMPSSCYSTNDKHTSDPAPEVVLENLLLEQNSAYLCLPNPMYENAPVSPPMSLQSIDSYETRVMSPAFDYEIDSFPASGVLYPNEIQYVESSTSGQEQEHYKTSQEYLQYQYQLQNQPQYKQYPLTGDDETNLQHGSSTFIQRQEILQESCIQKNCIGGCSSNSQMVSLPSPFQVNVKLGNINSTSATTMDDDVRNVGSSSITTSNLYGRMPQTRKRNYNTSKSKKPVQLQCATCFKTFSRPYNLKSHQRTHTNERPYVCLYPGCNWSFARPHDLKRHDQCLHAGIKPYKCSCGKKFARSDAFKRHQTIDSVCTARRNKIV